MGEKKKNRSGSKTRLEALQAYHQSLVVEKGLPPSRVMLKHSSSAVSPYKTAKKPMQEKVTLFKCEICAYQSQSLHGIIVHKGRTHKELKKPDVLAEDESSDFLDALASLDLLITH